MGAPETAGAPSPRSFLGLHADYGMSGPNSVTVSGSKECLFEAAKFTPFDGVVGKRGIVVDNREQTEGVRERRPTKPRRKEWRIFPKGSFIRQLQNQGWDFPVGRPLTP